MVSKYAPPLAAKVGLISGIVLYLPTQVIPPVETWLSQIFCDGKHPVHFLDILAVDFVITIIIMMIITIIKPRSQPYIQEYTRQVELSPWKHVKIAGATIAILAVAIYLFFSPLCQG